VHGAGRLYSRFGRGLYNRPTMRKTLIATLLALCAAAARGEVYGTRPDGRAVTSLAALGAKAVVLYFVASDCPISNRTLPEMQRVRQRFAAQGVAFWFVYPNSGETPHEVAQHQAEFGGGDALLDPQGRLVALTHARVTPEAAVLVVSGATWKPVYTGRIDDHYLRLGLERQQITEHFAEQAISEVLQKQPVQAATGTPVGCAIVNPKAPASSMTTGGSGQ
jgi:hypothetical protein